MTSAERVELIDRYKQGYAEVVAALAGIAPDELAVRFTYAERPLEAAMALFQGVRVYTAELLDRMTEADWAKARMPTPTGEYSTARWLQSYGPHAHEHAEQIRNNRDSFRSR